MSHDNGRDEIETQFETTSPRVYGVLRRRSRPNEATSAQSAIPGEPANMTTGSARDASHRVGSHFQPKNAPRRDGSR